MSERGLRILVELNSSPDSHW